MKLSRSKLLAVLLSASLTTVGTGVLSAAEPTVSVEAPDASQTIDVANALSSAFRNVAVKVLPSVVSIENRPDVSWQTSAKPPLDQPR